jgi:hypothetical protein
MLRLVILILVFLTRQIVFSQCLIDKDKALQIAFDKGFEKGIDSIKVTKIHDTIWRFECLLCDEDYSDRYDNININCITGKVEPSNYFSGITKYMQIGGKQRNYSDFPININKSPVLEVKAKPYLLTHFDNEGENRICISDKNVIAFAYGFRKIGIINIDGTGFKQICNECLYPQWIDNDFVAYYKDFEQVYKSNIHSLKQIRITKEKGGYDNFSISPNKKWLAYIIPPVRPERDSLGRINLYIHTCTDPEENDLWILKLSNPDIKKKINAKSDDIYNPTWSEKGDSLFFYIGDNKYFATDLEKAVISCSILNKHVDINLANYKKIKYGIFPAIIDCKIVSVDYNKRSVKNILINERGRYNECIFSNDQKYLIFTKSDKQYGNSRIWALNLTK